MKFTIKDRLIFLACKYLTLFRSEKSGYILGKKESKILFKLARECPMKMKRSWKANIGSLILDFSTSGRLGYVFYYENSKEIRLQPQKAVSYYLEFKFHKLRINMEEKEKELRQKEFSDKMVEIFVESKGL